MCIRIVPVIQLLRELNIVQTAGQMCFSMEFFPRMLVEGDLRHVNQQAVRQPTVSYSVPDGGTGGQQL